MNPYFLHSNLYAKKVHLKNAELFRADKRDEGNSRLRNFANDPKSCVFRYTRSYRIFLIFRQIFF